MTRTPSGTRGPISCLSTGAQTFTAGSFPVAEETGIFRRIGMTILAGVLWPAAVPSHVASGRDSLERQSLFGTFHDRIGLDSKLLCQVDGNILDSLNRNAPSQNLVSLLFFAGGPTAIFRSVIPVIVESIKGVFGRRSRSHVGNEICENVPSIADGDTASAVVFPLAPVYVSATVQHGLPYGVKFWNCLERHFNLPGFGIGIVPHQYRDCQAGR